MVNLVYFFSSIDSEEEENINDVIKDYVLHDRNCAFNVNFSIIKGDNDQLINTVKKASNTDDHDQSW